ncbi:MAG: ribonuclease P protein component [Candidatus Krumholzibacteriota bacterium]
MTAWRSLTKKSEFHKVYEQGAKQVGRFLVVYLLPADDMARAVVASKKVGNAVKRNRAKRLLREAFRQGDLGRPDAGFDQGSDHVMGIQKRLQRDSGSETGDPRAVEGLWVVLVARRSILGADSREVGEELDHLLGRWQT